MDELVIEGVATTIPADVAILESEAFQANTHSTNWVENGLDLTGVRYEGSPATSGDDDEPLVEKNVPVEVNGRRFDVKLWVPEGGTAAAPPKKKKRSSGGGSGSSSGGTGVIEAPMQGTIVVLEAMKMENAITADIDGTISEIAVAQGDSVGAGDLLAKITP